MSKAKAKPYQYMGVSINWTGQRVCKAVYKELELEIRSSGIYSRSLYIEGRKVHSAETIEDLKKWCCEYLKGA